MKMLKRSLFISIVLILLCGVIYPLVVTGISQLVFNKKANGSIAVYNNKKVGSELLGQDFSDKRFFKCRVSDVNYNTYTKEQASNGKVAAASGSSNLAPSSRALSNRIQKDMDEFLKTHPYVKKEDVPTDLLTSSGSGLDPDISPNAAKIQVPFVSKATNISEKKLQKIIDDNTDGRSLGIFGEERVNVLKVNLEICSILKIK